MSRLPSFISHQDADAPDVGTRPQELLNEHFAEEPVAAGDENGFPGEKLRDGLDRRHADENGSGKSRRVIIKDAVSG